MRFTIDTNVFYRALSHISKIVVLNDNQPIWSGIKMIADSNGLTLVARNMNMFIEKLLPLDPKGVLSISEEGSIVLPAKYLLELIKKMPETITVNAFGRTKVIIQSDEINVQMSSFPTEEYPLLPDVRYLESFHVPADKFIEMIRQTSFAASSSDSRPILTGMLLALEPAKLICAATNSHRLAIKEQEMHVGFEGRYIIPLPSVKELARLFQEDQKEIAIYITDSYLVCKGRNISFYTRLMEGTYPNLSALIPIEAKTIITINTQQLLRGVERAALFSRDSRNNHIKLEIKDGTSLKISSFSTDLGKIEEKQQCEEICGEKDLEISIDGTFFSDALKTIAEELVVLSFSGSMRPILIQPAGLSGHIHLISPVRT